MYAAEATGVRVSDTRQPSPRETWLLVRQSPRYDDLLYLVTQMRDMERELYVAQPASEFNRGKVVAHNQLLHFLTTGETP